MDYIKKNSKVLPDLVDQDVKKRIKHLRSEDMLNIFDMEHKVSGELQIYRLIYITKSNLICNTRKKDVNSTSFLFYLELINRA